MNWKQRCVTECEGKLNSITGGDEMGQWANILKLVVEPNINMQLLLNTCKTSFLVIKDEPVQHKQ
jgi:hypothetical protein